MQKIRIGVSGDYGSFSHQAALLYCNEKKILADLDYLIDMDAVLNALNKHKIDIGIFPVFNNTGGLVTQAFDAMGKYSFHFAGHFNLEIEHCLLVLDSIPLEKITQIISHPQALKQCEKFIQKNIPQAKIIEAIDTALAARKLQAREYPYNTAVIAPSICAQEYHLHLAQSSIQDTSPNLTTFVITNRG